jgi:tRNA/rRNA methyltransferase
MLDQATKTIILVRPQMGENIGACARSMKNFNFFNELRIVSPRDGWPNNRALSNAAGGIDIIESAKIFNSLDDAISDLEYIYACTVRKRDMNINSLELKEISNEYDLTLKTGIIFGPENSGLTNDEISLANKLVYISANPEFPSLNISQAVMLVCYEMRGFVLQKPITNNQDLVTKNDLKIFFDRLFLELENKKFFKVDEKKPIMKRNITNIFNRISNLSKSELKTLHGIIQKQ